MTDLDIIEQIKKELMIKLEELTRIEWYKKNTGYLLEYGRVTGLSLDSCELKDLNRIILFLKSLNGLTGLSLSRNLLNDISPLEKLKNLTVLDLSFNQLSDISPLKELKDLKELILFNNKLEDISPLRDLNKLWQLVLGNNPIEELPEWISNVGMGIQWDKKWRYGFITFFDNPLKTPPPEIVDRGKEAIKNYFGQLNIQPEDYLFEAKMIIVGEPGAGKTSLAWKMENPNCDLPKEEESTKGIDVLQYYFPLHKEGFPTFKHPVKLENRNFRLNLWDFGGQEIYKATHRFFLSKRSLYVLVADSRNEDTDFNYWLNIVEMFGGDGPLLIVLNEKYQRKRNIDISAMRKRFTNIVEVVEVDFAERDPARLKNLERAVKYYVGKLSHIGSPVPAKWTIIREAIEKNERNTISLQDYLAICDINGITKLQDALVLSQYFHDIGVFLHFQDDELLNKTIFLKPNSATNAVYKILDHPLLNQKNGRFNKADAKVIWSEAEYELVRDELLRLMQKFFLTYEIENSGEYIVPERLPSVQPEYHWDEYNNLRLRYEYDYFMPKGLLSQFTVQMHPYISNHNLVWRRGVVLERDNTKAEVIETYDTRNIQIKITGKHQRELITVITDMLERINGQFEKMKVEKLIPCNCTQCKASSNPYFYKYKDLKRRLENGIREVQCENSFKMVNVRSMIDEVIEEKKENSDMREVVKEQVASSSEMVKRDKVFVSYSHKDSEWLARVQVHLKVLKNLGIEVSPWDDTQIKPGMKWQDEIEKALAASKVAILLVSTDFLASDFITDNELPTLLKAAENDGATILPVILKPCLFDMHEELSQFQAVNDPNKPLTKMTEDEQDETLVALAKRVVELVKEK